MNDAEIPNNGVDDDENGFVDDSSGWNSGSNNDAIAAGGHGTSVSGVLVRWETMATAVLG